MHVQQVLGGAGPVDEGGLGVGVSRDDRVERFVHARVVGEWRRRRPASERSALHRFELLLVVRAEDRHLAGMAVLEIAQALLVVEAQLAVDFHHRLVEPQTGRAAAAVGVELAAVEVGVAGVERSEEHTSELQSRPHLVCRLLLEKKNYRYIIFYKVAEKLDLTTLPVINQHYYRSIDFPFTGPKYPVR